MQHPRMGGAKATSRRLFLWLNRGPSPLAAAARPSHERRAGQQGRRVILRPQKNKAGDQSRPPSSHAAKGCPSSASGSDAAGAASSCATRRADLTLPTPPRVV